MRRLLSTAIALGLVAGLVAVGVAAAGEERAERVRFVSKPATVVQGGTVRVVVAVSPSGVRCTAILGRGAAGLARSATVRAGRATFAWKLARGAQLGRWKITILCGRAGSASTSLTVARRTQPPPPVAARVVVEKSGFNLDDGFSTRQVAYGVVLRNVSPDEDALRVSITVSAVDANNKILKSDSTTVEAIPADATYYHGGDLFIGISEQPSRLEITVQVQERAKRSVALPPVSNLRVGTNVFGSARVFGEFSNPYTRTMSSFARITVVVFDGAGTVIGGGFTYPDASVPPRRPNRVRCRRRRANGRSDRQRPGLGRARGRVAARGRAKRRS